MHSERVDGRYRERLRIILAACVILLTALVGRVGYIQAVNGEYLKELADGPLSRYAPGDARPDSGPERDRSGGQ